MMETYNACAYMRLSQADDDKAFNDESNSIVNQRILIEEYILSHPEIRLSEEKVDDGYSGIYFDRPAFQEMISDIKNGKINCVIVKDLSRFGRNYIESGRYQEYFFSLHNVRFIAVNDCIDIRPGSDNEVSLMLPFKNIMNDAYSRDISVKTKSHMDIRRKMGRYLGAFAPYGYLKSSENRNQLIIDGYASVVVREIFDWRLEGAGTTRIAERLNNMCVLAPCDYKEYLDMNYKTPFKIYDRTKWTAAAVKRILINEVYTGNLAQGKTKKQGLKIKKSVRLEPEQWIRAKDTHEAIISAQDFELVQKSFAADSRERSGNKGTGLMSGMLYCPDCGKPMNHKLVTSNGKKYAYYICSSYQKEKRSCSSHLVSENALVYAVTEFLKRCISVSFNKDTMLCNIDKNEISLPENERRKLDILVNNISVRLENTEKLLKAVYQDWREGLLNDREYQELNTYYLTEKDSLNRGFKQLKRSLRTSVGEAAEKKHKIDEFIANGEFDRLTRAIFMRLIDKVVVYNKNDIRIALRFDTGYQH